MSGRPLEEQDQDEEPDISSSDVGSYTSRYVWTSAPVIRGLKPSSVLQVDLVSHITTSFTNSFIQI